MLQFHKMHGLSNDFVIIFTPDLPWDRARIAELADRHSGIGFDQLLWLSPSTIADVHCAIFNADGSEAEHCGNGMRCVARFAHEEKIVDKRALTIQTKAGLIPVEVPNYQEIRVAMGIPLLQQDPIMIPLDSQHISLTALSLGNPHAIYRVPTLNDLPFTHWGKILSNHAAFPQGANIGFMEIINRQSIRLCTYERGVGITQSCGSNACAAVISGISNVWLDSPVAVSVPSGTLTVEWPGDNQVVFLTGPATRVFSGTV